MLFWKKKTYDEFFHLSQTWSQISEGDDRGIRDGIKYTMFEVYLKIY